MSCTCKIAMTDEHTWTRVGEPCAYCVAWSDSLTNHTRPPDGVAAEIRQTQRLGESRPDQTPREQTKGLGERQTELSRTGDHDFLDLENIW